MFYRARIDANGICIGGYSVSNEPPAASDEIPVDGPVQPYMGRTWNGTEWSAPVPTPAVLSHLEFIGLCQSAGGMTDDMLVSAHNNAALAALWIKFDHAPVNIEKTHPLVSPGLTALAAAGVLPKGAQAVLDNWPNE